MKASSLVLLAFAAATLAVGCGRVVTVDDTNDASPTDNTGDSGPVSEGGPTSDAEAGPSSDKDADANPGICADYTPGGSPVGGPSDIGCTVAVDVNNGSLVMKTGSGSATLAGGVYQLTCNDGATVLMTARIDCYQGPGTYEVPAGALTLGTHVSDRKCRLGADTSTAGQLRGFIDCDSAPADPSNVFANSGPPIGLGDYAIPTN